MKTLARAFYYDFLESVRGSKIILFTNGCFDLLHYGHISMLKHCKDMADIVIVGVNSDKSVKRLKGDNRPIIGQYYRTKVLESVRYVDQVMLFDEDTPINLINKIKPDILVKGGDYIESEVVGRNIVKKYGGKVEIFPFIQDISTSSIIENILESND